MKSFETEKLSPLDGIVFDFMESLPTRSSRVFDDLYNQDDGLSHITSNSSRCVYFTAAQNSFMLKSTFVLRFN